MIKQIRIYSLGLIILAAACKGHKDQTAVANGSPGATTTSGSTATTSTTTSNTTATATVPDTTRLTERKAAIMGMPNHRLVVSFISIGTGIYSEGKEKLESYVASSEKKYGTAIAHVDGHWGREGETDVVFSLKELNESQQKEFIDGIKELFNGNKLILIEENREARTYRQ